MSYISQWCRRGGGLRASWRCGELARLAVAYLGEGGVPAERRHHATMAAGPHAHQAQEPAAKAATAIMAHRSHLCVLHSRLSELPLHMPLSLSGGARTSLSSTACTSPAGTASSGIPSSGGDLALAGELLQLWAAWLQALVLLRHVVVPFLHKPQWISRTNPALNPQAAHVSCMPTPACHLPPAES